MMAALEHGVQGPAAENRLHRVGQSGQIVVDQLRLQREGGRRDDHRAVHEQRRREIGERFAGAGAGLDEQVLAMAGGVGDRVRHRLLAGALGSARNGTYRRREQRVDLRPMTGGRGVGRRVSVDPASLDPAPLDFAPLDCGAARPCWCLGRCG